jgi:hypothetical protein
MKKLTLMIIILIYISQMQKLKVKACPEPSSTPTIKCESLPFPTETPLLTKILRS